MKAEREDKIQELVSDAIDGVFLKLQTTYDIESGDVPPEILYDVAQYVNKLSGAIQKYMDYAKPESEPGDFILTYHSRIGWWEDVCEIYEAKEKAMQELEKAKSVQYMKTEFEAMSIESEDGSYYYRVEFDN